MLERVVRMGILYHLYGPLLTERQQTLVDLYFFQDLSLGEIASQYKISRQAVHDNLRRAQETLEGCEAQLHMEKRIEEIQRHLLQLQEEIRPLLDPGEQDKKGQIDLLFTQLMDLLD